MLHHYLGHKELLWGACLDHNEAGAIYSISCAPLHTFRWWAESGPRTAFQAQSAVQIQAPGVKIFQAARFLECL